MSIQAVGWVLDHSKTKGIDRLVLIALANHADSRNGRCWPSMRLIAAECGGISIGTVHAAVERISAAHPGELVKYAAGGPHKSATYRLPFASTEPVDNPVRNGDKSESGVQEMNAAFSPGENAAFSPGRTEPSVTITNHHESSATESDNRTTVGMGANGPLREHRAGDDRTESAAADIDAARARPRKPKRETA